MAWIKNGGSESSATTKTLRILTIGNSFSDDATQWLYDIAKSAGANVIIGNLSMSGQSLQGHWEQISGDLAAYRYFKYSSSGSTTTTGKTMEFGLKDENWDIISLQQVSGKAGVYSTFQPYLNDIISYIKGLATNPNMKFAFHRTWAYATGANHTDFPLYNSDQMTMYHAISDGYLQAMKETNIDIIIPSGTAIQNARSSAYLKAIGTELTRDGYHLDLGMGRYIAGLTFFETLIATRFQKDIFTDVSFIPNIDGDDTAFNAYLAKVAVKTAKVNPFNVTTI
ncbi:DUF4886 domain-containing protein [Priestia filamentosa]|uniref:DUF4886 domain-containing protein n=1 Tax=Priestia filamentosa TaxID=1402861 RepID=UPI003981D877